MAIAKGRTNCKAERDLVLQGFAEQLQLLEKSQIEQEDLFKARLYDIINDSTINLEEKDSLKESWLKQFKELEEHHTRIRRSIFIGLYSFWEISLKYMVDAHIRSLLENTHKSKETKFKGGGRGVSKYLKVIYKDNLPSSNQIINNNIREFRNYMFHGTLNENRDSLINVLTENYKEFCIKGMCKDYFISDYKGIVEFLNLFVAELDNAENKTLKIKNGNILKQL